MKDKKRVSLWERYLTKEIGIEFKACLYFFAMLFFYCMYRVCIGQYYASILHMAEMIFLTYAVGGKALQPLHPVNVYDHGSALCNSVSVRRHRFRFD